MPNSLPSTPLPTASNVFEPPFGSAEGIYSIPPTTSSITASTLTGLTNPTISNSNRPSRPLDLVLPVAYFNRNKEFQTIDGISSDSFKTFVKHDLSVARLNQKFKHLYVAGSPVCAHSLHEQVLIGRSFIVTEQADLHLVWHSDDIYLKPLPEYLLDFQVWLDVLCRDQDLFEDANGMLLSYMWLICSKSDLKLAHTHGLLADDIDWNRWTTFSRTVLCKLDHHGLVNISPRYLYGELRLPRLNFLFRLYHPFHNPLAPNPIWGYHYGHRQYNKTVDRYFGRLLAATVYVTVVLTAMQVGLGTTVLQEDFAFNRVSYGFTVFSIIAPLALVFIILVVQFAHVAWKHINALNTRHKKQKSAEFEHVFENATTRRSTH